MKREISSDHLIVLSFVVMVILIFVYYTWQKQNEMVEQQNRLLQPLAAMATIKVMEYQAMQEGELKLPERQSIVFKFPNSVEQEGNS